MTTPMMLPNKNRLHKRQLAEETEAAEAEVTVDAEAMVRNFVAMSGDVDPENTGYWVDVTIPIYKGLRVLYRTSNPTIRRKQRPVYNEPLQLTKLRKELRHITDSIAVEWTEELELQQAETLKKVIDASEEYEQQYHHELSRWLQLFVRKFDGWTFKNIEQPDPNDPDSYFILYQELEDLYYWLMDPGYQAALRQSVGNS